MRELEYILFSGDDNSKIGKELRKKMTKQKREDEFAATLEAEKSDTEAPSPQKSVHSPVKTQQKSKRKRSAQPVSPRR